MKRQRLALTFHLDPDPGQDRIQDQAQVIRADVTAGASNHAPAGQAVGVTIARSADTTCDIHIR